MGRNKKDLGPTPELTIEQMPRKHFTYSENQLLDQITLEITRAWAKDLKSMRETYKAVKLAQETIDDNIRMSISALDSLDRLLGASETLDLLDLIEKVKKVHEFLYEVRKELFDFTSTYKGEEIIKVKKELAEIKTLLDVIVLQQKEMSKKKWWKFWA